MSNEEKWREDKYRDEFEDELGGVYGLGRFSRMDDGYEAEKLNILWRGYRVGRQHSEKEIELLKIEAECRNVMLSEKQEKINDLEQCSCDCDLKKKELEKYKAGYEVLKEAIDFYASNENWQSLWFDYGYGAISIMDREDLGEGDMYIEYGGKRAREASKRAALIVGDGE